MCTLIIGFLCTQKKPGPVSQKNRNTSIPKPISADTQQSQRMVIQVSADTQQSQRLVIQVSADTQESQRIVIQVSADTQQSRRMVSQVHCLAISFQLRLYPVKKGII